ncbi:MAG: glycosyltransferase family 2 protein [Planctomycetes bacterium]|nr:glycosyltransferase family 2 protein [Planctomycetota bacterium]
MRLLIVIVNYRTAELTLQALEAALPQLEAIGGEAVVVENASGDAAQLEAAIRERWSGRPVRLVVAPRNGGFGYGNNLAIRPALESDDPPDYVYLLNPDAYPDPGALQALLDYMDSHPLVGIAGTYVHFPDGSERRSMFRFPTVLGELCHGLRVGFVDRLLHRHVAAPPVPQENCQAQVVSGASMILRREVLEEVGLFDEGFFLYYEETDLCLRAARAGWHIHYVRDSSVGHVGGAATHLDKGPIPRYWFASRRRYFLKNHGRAYMWLANLVWGSSYLSWVTRKALLGQTEEFRPRRLRDFVAANLALEWEDLRQAVSGS